MKSVSLTVYPRKAAGRNAVKQLRQSGRVPAVIYGAGNPPRSLEVVTKQLENTLHHHASESLLMDLKVAGENEAAHLAVVKEIQHHPLTGAVLHVDFLEVKADEPVEVSVPVKSVGEAVGVKTGGGVLDHVMHKIKIRALPRDLPEVITVDVSALEIGRAIHVSEVQPPPNVEFLADPEQVLFTCAAPRVEEEVTEEAAPEGEVEMIKEKKEEGEGAEKGEDKAAGKDAEKK